MKYSIEMHEDSMKRKARNKRGREISKSRNKIKRESQRAGKRKKPASIAAVFFIVIILFMVAYFLEVPGQPYRFLGEQELLVELQALDITNRYPNNLNINPANYPRILGIYTANGLLLTEVYYCSDLCPESGAVIIIFEDVERDECSIVGGREYLDPAWGSYVGCTPDIGRPSIRGS